MNSPDPSGGWVSQGKRNPWSFVWLLLSLAAAAWIVWSSRDDISLLTEASPMVVVAMVGAHGASLVTQSERFRLVLESHADVKFSLPAWMRLFTRGRLFSYMLPQSGHVYRGVALKQDHGTSALRYVSSLATQTWLAVSASLAFATLILLVAVPFEQDSGLLGPIGALSAATLLVGFAPFLVTRLSGLMPARLRRTRVARRAMEAWRLGRRTARDRALVGLFLVHVLIGLLTASYGMKIAFAITGQTVSWIDAVVILAFVYLGNIIAVTPGNLGVQELGVAALAAYLGYPSAAGVVASVVVRLSNIVALVLMALIFESHALVRDRSGVH